MQLSGSPEHTSDLLLVAVRSACRRMRKNVAFGRMLSGEWLGILCEWLACEEAYTGQMLVREADDCEETFAAAFTSDAGNLVAML